MVGVGSVGSGAQPQDGCLYGQVEGTCQRSLPAVLGKGEAAPQERGDGIACFGYSAWFGSRVKKVLVKSQPCSS